MITPEAVSAFESLLWPDDSPEQEQWVYAVLDSAHDRSIASTLFKSFARYECLYEGELTSEMKAVAPYLIRLRKGEPYTNWLLSNLPQKNWGIFIRSEVSFKELRRHLRRFLRVKTEEGKTLLFRWYDPRVLRLYLPTCSEEELQYVFGPAQSFIAESETNNTFHEYSLDNSILHTQNFDITHSLVEQ